MCVSHHGFFPKVFEVFGRATHEKEIRERRKRHLLFCLHIFDNLAVDQKIVCNNHEDLENEQANERKSEILFPRALHLKQKNGVSFKAKIRGADQYHHLLII